MLAFLFSMPAFGADTVRIFFPLAQFKITAPAIKTLDSAFYFELLKRDSRLKIYGYADFMGSTASNQILSLSRAQAVKNYLIQEGIPPGFITLVTGKGEVQTEELHSQNGIPGHRRVDIVVLNNGENSVPQNASTVVLSTENTALPTLIAHASAGDVLRLDKIFFQPGLAILREESVPELQALLKVMQENKTLSIRLEGHVCCIDTKRFSDALDDQTLRYELSQNRAKMVAEYLTKHSIEQERVSHIGFGKKHPVYVNEQTQTEADANRRVEVRILRK